MTGSGSGVVATKPADRPQDAPARRTIHALTGIRFLAAAWVVVYHFRDEVQSMIPGFRQLESITGAGHLGVDLFFILSGFIIAYNYSATFARGVSKRDYSRFLWLRLARMYPVHLATLLFLLGLVIAARVAGRPLSNPFGAGNFIKSVLLVNAWEGRAGPSWNYPAWSISAEWFAYLLFPFMALAFRRVRSVRASGLAAACALSLLFVAMFVFDANTPLVRVVTEFTAGMFLARVFAESHYSAAWDWAAASALCLVPLVLLLTSGSLEAASLIIVFACLVLSLAHSRRGVARLLSTSWMVFLGEASYALYMTHALVEMVGNKVLPMGARAGSPLVVRLLIVLMYAAVLGAVAVGTHMLLERPARDRLRRVGPGSSAKNGSITPLVHSAAGAAHVSGPAPAIVGTRD